MSEIYKDWLPLFEWHKRHYPKQVDFVKALDKYWEVVFCAGNGCGKTAILYWSLITLALGIHPHQIAPPPLRIKILVNDFEHGLEQIFKDTCMASQELSDGTILGPMLPESAVKSLWSRDDRSILFNNGSAFFFQTSEQKKKLHSGTNFDILACDEEQPYQIYDESKRGLRTAKGGGKILHSFTPPFDQEDKQVGPSWTKFELIDKFEKGENPDLYVVRAAMYENPAITQEYIDKFIRGKTEEQIKIQVYGEYPTWGKPVHPGFEDFLWDASKRTGNLLPESFEINWNDLDLMFEMAVDWHSSKAAAIVWSFEYLAGPNKGDVVIFDELSPESGKGLTITQVSDAIREVEGWRNIRIKRWADPKMKDKNNALVTGFNAWDEFRHCGIRFTEGKNRDPGVGISTVNDYLTGKTKKNLQHPRLFIRENCRTLRHNLKNHYWQRGNNGIGSPDPKFSDYCVSMRYIVQEKARKTKKPSDEVKKWPITSYGDNFNYKRQPRLDNSKFFRYIENGLHGNNF